MCLAKTTRHNTCGDHFIFGAALRGKIVKKGEGYTNALITQHNSQNKQHKEQKNNIRSLKNIKNNVSALVTFSLGSPFKNEIAKVTKHFSSCKTYFIELNTKGCDRSQIRPTSPVSGGSTNVDCRFMSFPAVESTFIFAEKL